jgi:predicted transcriptional regulator
MNRSSAGNNESVQALAAVITNPRRMSIMDYLVKCRYAQNVTISKCLSLRPSQVSKDLCVLMKADLVLREKIGRRVIYQVMEEKWKKVTDLIDW